MGSGVFLRGRRVGFPDRGGWVHESKAFIAVCEHLAMGLGQGLAALLIVHGSRASRYCSLVD